MKKIAFLLLASLLLLSHTAFAKSSGSIRFSAEKNDLARGEDFSVSVEMPRNPGVKTLRLKAEYSAEQLELLLAEDEAILDGGLFAQTYDENASSYVLYWSQERESDATGTIAHLYFKVKDSAPVGLCALSMTLEAGDSADEAGEPVLFDLPTLYLNIVCRHENAEATVVKPVSFAENGLQKFHCPDCGEEWEEELFPSVTSRDGKVVAHLTAGEFAEDAEPVLTLQTFLAGADYTGAKKEFGARLQRAFRLKFTLNGAGYSLNLPAAITLSGQEEGLELYAMEGDSFLRVDCSEESGVYRFLYRDALFAFVLPEKEPAPADPPVTEPTPAEPSIPATDPNVPEESLSTRDLLLLAGGGVLIAVLAAVIFWLLRAKQREL